jgi:cytochrome P450
MTLFARITKSTVELMGSSLEPGTIVIGCIYLAHHREDVYPDLDEFKPERFWNVVILLLSNCRLVGVSGVALVWRLPNSR